MEKKIAIIVFCFMFVSFGLSNAIRAEDLGTDFSYQGRLETAGSEPLNGSYDFEFSVHDTPIVIMEEPNVPVTEGIFTVRLDPDPNGTAPNLFNGEVRYLEIAVRKTGSAESYFTISPRQRINAAPYAITASSARWLRGRNSTEKVVYVDDSGNVGVGTTTPSAKFEVKGRIKDETGFVMPVGTILAYSAATAPSGWLFCNGDAVSRSTYDDLFALIGTTYGSGDGSSTTFNLPDLREAAPVGIGQRASGVAIHDEFTLGQFKDDQFQNIIGYIGYFNTYAAIHGTSWGAFYRDNAGNSTGIGTGSGDAYHHVYFNAAYSPEARAGDITRGKRLGVNFIIKH